MEVEDHAANDGETPAARVEVNFLIREESVKVLFLLLKIRDFLKLQIRIVQSARILNALPHPLMDAVNASIVPRQRHETRDGNANELI